MIRDVLRKLIAITPKQKARQQLLSLKLGETDIAIDCGANVGDITAHLSRSGATVYAFEPNLHAFDVLQKRFSHRAHVHCLQKGVSDETKIMKLYLHEYSTEDEVRWSTGSSMLAFKANVSADKFIEVETIDLCAFIETLNHQVRVLKMDVEGLECKILEKLIKTGVIYKIDQLFVETHDQRIPELKAETEAIRALIKEKGLKHINLDWL